MALFIYIIAFLEGFTTLSIEIIAIRNFTPIIGTNSISTSIILGIILLALSYGYYIGGKNSNGKNKDFLKNKIVKNLTIAALYYMFFTFQFDDLLIESFLSITDSYFFSILFSSFLLFFIPVFFASQTIPLLSEVLAGDNTGEKIGKLLFFSTIGSFCGSVGTSSLLFAFIGVSKTATLNSVILSFLAILIYIKSFKKFNFTFFGALLAFLFGIVVIFTSLNNNNFIYEKANSYHNIEIFDTTDGKRLFTQNGGFSSGIDLKTKESFFGYIKEIKKNLLEGGYKNIGIIGAAGFTLPNELSKNTNIEKVDVVDVDGTLKDISEKYFLNEKVGEKVNFIVSPARYFLNNKIKSGEFYDAMVIDIYVGNSMPPQTLTFEFFDGLTKISKDIFINIITDKSLKSDFSNKLLNTIAKAFGDVYYYDTQSGKNSKKTNFVITNKNINGYTKFDKDEKKGIYTDDKNSIELDLFNILKG